MRVTVRKTSLRYFPAAKPEPEDVRVVVMYRRCFRTRNPKRTVFVSEIRQEVKEDYSLAKYIFKAVTMGHHIMMMTMVGQD